MRQPSISDAEWEVMEVVWDREPVGSTEVCDALAGSKRSPRTVKTMLNRLLGKGFLEAEAEGKRYLYRACVSREECVDAASDSFRARVFGGEEAPMITHLVRNADLSPDAIRKLREMLEQKERESDA